MAYELVILEGAQHDYEAAVEYLFNVKKSPQATLGFMDEFDRQLDLVRENPLLHAPSRMPELAALGYRAFFVNNYVALYFFRNERVAIAHLFHQTQDYASLVLERNSR